MIGEAVIGMFAMLAFLALIGWMTLTVRDHD